jgi:RNA polymerase sigma factor (sigma-70 family)
MEARSEGAITVGELEDARLGFFQSLSRRFGREFKERHGDDLFAQALYEFSRKVEQGEEIRNPAAWITHCAWNRSKTEMEARTWRPQLVPTESLPTEPVAEPSWQPEEHVLSEDRLRKLEEAVDQLPKYQRELLARHYFEGESVREASRRMGWSEGKGARTHNAARKRLREIFAGLRSSDLEAVGFLSFLSLAAAGRGGAVEIPGGLEATLDRAGHALSDGWHRAVHLARHPLGGGRPADLAVGSPPAPGRLSQLGRRIFSNPLAETAATAGDGPGRMIEVCKGLAVCAVSGAALTAGVVGTGGGQRTPHTTATRPAPRHTRQHHLDEGGTKVPANAGATEAKGVEDTSAESPPPAEHHREARGSGGASVAHSISGTKVAAGTAAETQESVAQEVQAQEATSSREAFAPFEGRGEAEPTEPRSSGAQVESLSEAKSSSTAQAAEPSSPKEAAEKRAAGEQFGGALR